MYWIGKYLYVFGELNIFKKSVSFLVNYICIKIEVSFNGNFGEEEDNFVLSFSNELIKVGIDLIGRFFKVQKEGVFCLFVCLCEQLFIFCGFYVKVGDERGICFIVSYDNKNCVIRWYIGIINVINEKFLKINVMVFGSKVEVVWMYFNFMQSKGVKFNGLFLNKFMDVVWLYVNFG